LYAKSFRLVPVGEPDINPVIMAPGHAVFNHEDFIAENFWYFYLRAEFQKVRGYDSIHNLFAGCRDERVAVSLVVGRGIGGNRHFYDIRLGLNSAY